MRTGTLKTNNGYLAWLFLGPSLLGFSLFYLLPFVTGFYYSLVESPINGTFVGLHNYAALSKNPSFIVQEETASFFTGRKTAETTAQLIQDRVSTYLNE